MDLKIITDKQEFHARACGIIKQGDKFLVMRANRTDYFHIPGGHIELGETAEEALRREIMEEIGCGIAELRLFAIQENFWIRDGRDCHGIEFYYVIKPDTFLNIENGEKIEIDKGKEKILEFRWATADELKDINLKPANIKELVISGKYETGLSHIVKR